MKYQNKKKNKEIKIPKKIGPIIDCLSSPLDTPLSPLPSARVVVEDWDDTLGPNDGAIEVDGKATCPHEVIEGVAELVDVGWVVHLCFREERLAQLQWALVHHYNAEINPGPCVGDAGVYA